MELKLLIICSVLFWAGLCQECSELYEDNIYCQDVQDGNANCVTCTAGAGDDVGLPCPGLKVSLFQTGEDMCGWCPQTCLPYIEEGGKCWTTITSSQAYGICGPGLTCSVVDSGAGAECVKMTAGPHCMVHQAAFDAALAAGQLGMDQRRPECDEEGDWAPVQCSGGGICRCVRHTDGQPIFGLETNMTAVDQMTCGCARQAETMRELGCAMKVKYEGDSPASLERYRRDLQQCLASQDSQFFTGQLRCDPNGNFDPAQCISQTTEEDYNPSYDLETCFCYYEGHPLNGSMAPINIAPDVLDCHREGSLHYPDYYRLCEKYNVEKRKLIAKNKAEGRVYIAKERLEICDIDGFYAKVQRNSTDRDSGFCSDKLGEQILSYSGEFSVMDCECAMVESLLTGWGERPACTEDGSYVNVQCKAGKCYCVDRYGRQCEKEVAVDEVDELQCSDKTKAPENCEGYLTTPVPVTTIASTIPFN